MIRFSLLMTTLNRVIELEKFLKCLNQQTYREFELIVVDQNQDDRLDTILYPYKNLFSILHIHSSSRGASSGRNEGLQLINGDIVGFPDDDCWYSKDLLGTLAERFSMESKLDGIIGRIIDIEGNDFARFPKHGIFVSKRNVFECSCTTVVFLRTYVVKEIGTFDEQLGPGARTLWQSGDDTDYITRAIQKGFRLLYDPNIIVYHPRKSKENDLNSLQRAYGYGCGMGKVLKKHNFPLWRVGYYLARPFGGMLLSLLRRDKSRATYYWLNLRGRWDGWRSM